MADFLPVLAALGGVAGVICGLAGLASRVRRRGAAGAAFAGAMAAYDEAFHGTAHDSYVEVQSQARRMSPIPSPGTD